MAIVTVVQYGIVVIGSISNLCILIQNCGVSNNDVGVGSNGIQISLSEGDFKVTGCIFTAFILARNPESHCVICILLQYLIAFLDGNAILIQRQAGFHLVVQFVILRPFLGMDDSHKLHSIANLGGIAVTILASGIFLNGLIRYGDFILLFHHY